jgi:DNA-binding response OmpR family regulator
MLILIVEDEPRIAGFLRKGLKAEGYATVTAGDVAEAVTLACGEPVDLVLLDLILPSGDGLEALRSLRRHKPELPVLVLTARDEVESRVQGLDMGADDYLTKPFSFDELLARVRALLRRQHASAVKLEVGSLTLDLRRRNAEAGPRRVNLTVREAALLEFFLRHPNQVLSRIQLLSNVWPYEAEVESNVVDVYVRYLRRKVPWPRGVALETARGAGYRLVAP